MRKWCYLIIAATAFLIITMLVFKAKGSHVEAESITGGGSSFVYPIMVKWTKVYYKKTRIEVNYQSIGSGGGVRQLKVKTVDFAASDEPLSSDELTQNNWQQYPLVMGGIVPVVNIAGIGDGELVLSGNVLAAIYLGKIRYWDDKVIRALNPGLTLPHARIIPIYRSDSSGTSYNFTYYLSQVSPVWKSKIGFAVNVSWPMGLGGKGNSGVAAQVMEITNSIGYVEYAYILHSQLTYIAMKNRSNVAVQPTITSLEAGIRAGKQQLGQEGAPVMMNNPPGSNSWPILATTFVMLSNQLSPEKLKTVRDFLAWCYQSGSPVAKALSYIPVPSETYTPIIAKWQHS